jgi:hypothetical protein
MKKPKKRPEPKTQAEFASLQKEWYDYLKDTGFDDLEWVDHKTGKGQGSDYLKQPSMYLSKQYDASVEEYYRKCRIFLQHGDFKSGTLKFVFKRHTEGASYRDIAAEIERYPQRFGRTYSIFWISQRLNEMLEYMEYWHYMHPEGLLNPGSQDFVVEDLPLKPLDPESE